MTDNAPDAGTGELWELLWMITEEAQRKLPNEQRDPVMKAISEHDSSQIECLGRGESEIAFRVSNVVFHVAPVTKTTEAEPAPDLPEPNFFPKP